MTDDELYTAWAALRPQYRIGVLKVADLLHDDVHEELARPDSLFASELGMAVARVVMDALGLYTRFLEDTADARYGSAQPDGGLN